VIRLILASIFWTTLACQTQKSNDLNNLCFSFDQRQCQVDSFVDFITNRDEPDANIEGIINFLTEQNIKVQHAKVDMSFHEFTCNACEVCPESHRFFVSISALDKSKILKLNLMSLEEISCLDHF